MNAEELRFKQILIAPWEDRQGKNNYSTIGLTEDGRVFKYATGRSRWVPFIMKASNKAVVGSSEEEDE